MLADIVESTRRVLPFERLAHVGGNPHVIANVLASVNGACVLFFEVDHRSSPFSLYFLASLPIGKMILIQ